MTEDASEDDRYSVTFVNRRRVLLAVGGIVLTIDGILGLT